MNHLIIIGNLTKDADTRITQSGHNVTSFTVAVNRRRRGDGQQEADFFRVTAWNALADNCQKYLAKGKKVAVTGSVSVSSYQGKDGKHYATLEIMADNVEFLSPKEGRAQEEQGKKVQEYDDNGYVEVNEDDLPF